MGVELRQMLEIRRRRRGETLAINIPRAMLANNSEKPNEIDRPMLTKIAAITIIKKSTDDFIQREARLTKTPKPHPISSAPEISFTGSKTALKKEK